MKILDCTLRDGGYYTLWDFDRDTVHDYLTAMNNLPIDYLEIGYRSRPLSTYFGKYFYCPLFELKEIKRISKKKIAIIINEKDFRKEDTMSILHPVKGYVSLVRIAVDPKNFLRAIELAKEIKKLDFEVAFNVMYMSKWYDDQNFLSQTILTANVVDYFYMVDSFGSVYPDQVKQTIKALKANTNTKLGFHGHNNLELALINSLTAIENGVDMIDGTILGMGRGAGNLKTELLLTVLNQKNDLEVEYNDLSKVVDVFAKLQEQYKWGTNLPYMVSGANSLPQKKVMEWVTKRYYSYNSIIRALKNESEGRVDNQKFTVLNCDPEPNPYRALIIGGGNSPNIHYEGIRKFLAYNQDTIIIHASSKNAMAFANFNHQQYYCLVGNEGYRLEKVFNNRKINGQCILPPYPREMGTYVPDKLKDQTYELNDVAFTDKYNDSHTAIALQSALHLGVSSLFIAGYDGYSGDNISQREQELFIENEYLFQKVKSSLSSLISLTPTSYTELESISIYADLD